MRKRLSDHIDWSVVEARLEATLRAATSAQWRDGLRWYPRAHHIAETLVCFSELTVDHGAGIIAALSPQAAWESNVEQATDLAFGRPIRNTADRCDKASRILGGEEPLSVLNGPKETAFYLCISEPLRSRRACIDRHMVRAALNVQTDKEIRLWADRAGVYDRISDAIVRIADRFNIPVPATQAIIWNVVRDARQSANQ